MRITITVALALLSVIADAQTMDSTVGWIRDKINEYGSDVKGVNPVNKRDYIANTYMHEDSVVKMVSFVITYSNGVREELRFYWTININDIMASEKDVTSQGYYRIKVRPAGSRVMYKDADNKVTYIDYFYFELNWNAEKNLYNRFNSALERVVAYKK